MTKTDPIRRSRCRAAGLVLLAALVAGCEADGETSVAPADMLELEAPVVFGMVSYLSATGVREGRIEADTAYTHPDSARVDLHGMRVVFYGENGEQRATVEGRSGEWNQDTDRLVARGDVELFIHTDSSRLESAEIHYDPEEDRVWSDSATVRTLADGSVTRGSSFESDINFENVLVRDPRGAAGRVF